MKDYWLAKLIASSRKVDSRKRLQKSIFLLQRAGCPLQCEYILHYYGPYSFELAGLIDQLKGADVIRETPEPLAAGVARYKSAITPRGRNVLESFEKTKAGKKARGQIKPFMSGFKLLVEEDPWVLELAATVAYYYDCDWEYAKACTATVKGIHDRNSRQLLEATELAKKYVMGR
jgi:uncharacterized protein YwgA